MDKVSNFKPQIGKLQLALKFKIVCGDVVQMLNLIIIIIIIIIKKKIPTHGSNLILVG